MTLILIQMHPGEQVECILRVGCINLNLDGDYDSYNNQLLRRISKI